MEVLNVSAAAMLEDEISWLDNFEPSWSSEMETSEADNILLAGHLRLIKTLLSLCGNEKEQLGERGGGGRGGGVQLHHFITLWLSDHLDTKYANYYLFIYVASFKTVAKFLQRKEGRKEERVDEGRIKRRIKEGSKKGWKD